MCNIINQISLIYSNLRHSDNILIVKKFLEIVVLSLLLAHNSFAKTINIEDKIFLNVPENFNSIKIEANEVADYYSDFFKSLGEKTAFYYIGTNSSIEFVNALINDQDKLLEPLMKKMEAP